MKIISISAVLCLATSTFAATRHESASTEHNVALQAAHPKSPANVHRRPVGVMRHEWLKKHKEHGLEAHRDGPRRKSSDKDDNNDDDDSSSEDHMSKKDSGDDDDDSHDSSSSDDHKSKKDSSDNDDSHDPSSSNDHKSKKDSGDDDEHHDKEESSVDKKQSESSDEVGNTEKEQSHETTSSDSTDDHKEEGTDDTKKGDTEDNKKGGTNDNKKGGTDKKEGPNKGKGKGKAPGTGTGTGDKKTGGGKAKGGEVSNGKDGKKGAGKGGKTTPGTKPGTTTPTTGTDAKVSDLTSPMWLVQPFGSSVWEQGVEYVVAWGPNPDPVYAKTLPAKAPLIIRLMQGPPEHLKEIQILGTHVDSSRHMFKWRVPATLPPAKDYSIRLTAEGKLDTYSHYFEVVRTGDKRSTKSNVGEPLQMPKAGDVPLPLNSKIAPAPPPNPVPDVKKQPAAGGGAPIPPSSPGAPVPPAANEPTTKESGGSMPSVSKPAVHSDGVEVKSNMLAFALTLFGAVYFL